MMDHFCYTKFVQSFSEYMNDCTTLISVYTLFGVLLFTYRDLIYLLTGIHSVPIMTIFIAIEHFVK